MIRILLVDDHALVRHGFAKILSEAFPGARFGEAGDAGQALALLHAGEWDVALIDLNLPGRDGLALLADVRAAWPKLPVLILSMQPEEEFPLRCLRLGALGYLTKSSAPDELAAAVRKALAGKRFVSAALAERLAALTDSDFVHAPHEALSNRELQVLRMVASGLSLKQIAAELHLSERTIGTYRARIAEKLRVSTNVELTRYALKHQLLN